MKPAWTGPDSGRRLAGIAMVELAIAAPIVVLLVFAGADIGRAYYQHDAMNKAVQAAAGYYARNLNSDGLTMALKIYNDNMQAAGITGATAPTVTSNVDYVTMTATYTYQWMTPLPALAGAPASLTLTAYSRMRILP